MGGGSITAKILEVGMSALLMLPDGSGEGLPQPYEKYLEVLETIREEGHDLCGLVFHSDPEADFEKNHFAICDVNGDGRQELLFSFSQGDSTAGKCEVVYAWEEETDTLQVQLRDWLGPEYYHTGLVKVDASHNHGKDPYERGVWPYWVCQYDAEQGQYQEIYYVDAWDGSVIDTNFPDELDRDGDKLVYCVTVMDGGELPEVAPDAPDSAVSEADNGETEVILDQEEYEAWTEGIFPEWERVDVTYHPIAEGLTDIIRDAYAQASAYAAQADLWFEAQDAGTFGEYLLCDLDGDGSLELTASVMQGTGRYSYNHFYSLDGNGKAGELAFTRLCDSEEREWNADFDLGGRNRPSAYQDGDGVIYYEGHDYTKEGIYGGYDETGFFYLRDGVVYQDSIRWCSMIYHGTDGQEDEITYYSMSEGVDGSPEEITEEDYEAIREKYIAGMTEKDVYHNWVYFTGDELEEISEGMIRRKLFESFMGSR